MDKHSPAAGVSTRSLTGSVGWRRVRDTNVVNWAAIDLQQRVSIVTIGRSAIPPSDLPVACSRRGAAPRRTPRRQRISRTVIDNRPYRRRDCRDTENTASSDNYRQRRPDRRNYRLALNSRLGSAIGLNDPAAGSEDHHVLPSHAFTGRHRSHPAVCARRLSSDPLTSTESSPLTDHRDICGCRVDSALSEADPICRR